MVFAGQLLGFGASGKRKGVHQGTVGRRGDERIGALSPLFLHMKFNPASMLVRIKSDVHQ